MSTDLLNKADWSKPTPGVLGLATIESIGGTFYIKDPVELQCSILKELCLEQDRFKSLADYEWARLNPNRIVLYLKDGEGRKVPFYV